MRRRWRDAAAGAGIAAPTAESGLRRGSGRGSAHPRKDAGTVANRRPAMPIVVRPIASGNVTPSRATRCRPASRRRPRGRSRPHRPAVRVKSRGRAGMAAAGMAADTATSSANRSAQVVAGRERGLGAGPFGGAQVGVAGRERGDPLGIVARVLVGGGRRDCSVMSSARRPRGPGGSRTAADRRVRIIAPTPAWRRCAGREQRRHRPRSGPPTRSSVTDRRRGRGRARRRLPRRG